MEILKYRRTYDPIDSIETFLDLYYGLQMNFLASDLLEKGLSPEQIYDAVLKAMRAGASSGIDIRKHFMPVFSERFNQVFNDCKLSRMAYGLVLLNADVDLSLVGQLQVRIINNFIKARL